MIILSSFTYAADYIFQSDDNNGSDVYTQSDGGDVNYGTAELIKIFGHSSYTGFSLLNWSYIFESIPSNENITNATMWITSYAAAQTEYNNTLEVNCSWSELTATYNNMGGSAYIDKCTTGAVLDVSNTFTAGAGNKSITFNTTWLTLERNRDPKDRKWFLLNPKKPNAIDSTNIYSREQNGQFAPAMYIETEITELPKSLDTVIRNRAGNSISINTISENDVFHVSANYTEDNIALIGGVCNYSAENISSHYSVENVNNFSLTSVTTIDLLIDEETDNMVQDYYNFRVCREAGASVDMQIYINNSINDTIGFLEIPLCSSGGFHEENVVTSEFFGLSNLEISLRCDSCTGIREYTVITRQDEILQFNREYTHHTVDLEYNTTSELYSGDHLHAYIKQYNDISLNVSCNETTDENTFSVLGSDPTIVILSIDNVPFTQGMQVESNDTTEILIDAYGDIIQSIELNITYANNSLIRSVSTENITLTKDELNIDGFYNISVTAVDDEGNRTTINDYFRINDTVPPVNIWNMPSKSNATNILNGSFYQLNITLTDINLFAYELLIKEPGDQLIYNISQTGGLTSPFTIDDNLFFNRTGVWTLELTVSDDHTAQLIENYDYEIYEKIFDKKTVRFDFDDIRDHKLYRNNVTLEYTGKYVTTDLNLIKLEDRYIFQYAYDLDMDRFAKEVTHKYRLTCEGLTYLPLSEYKAHFVCWDARKWIDFESPDIINYYADECGENCYDITLITNPRTTLTFNSIGGLNIVLDVVTLTSLETLTPNLYNSDLLGGDLFNYDVLDTNTTAGMLAFFFLLIILIVMVIFSEYLQIPIFVLLTSIYWVFLGILFYVTIAAIMGVIFIILGLFYAIRSIIMAKD